jgi:hypothetical protein
LPEKYLAAVAFMGGPIGVNARAAVASAESGATDVTVTAATNTTAKQPLQCITLQRTMLINQNESDVDESTSDADDTKEQSSHTAAAVADVAVVNSQAALLQALQLYSRNLFLPSLKDQTILQEKIRQLNVAIGQSQQSATLPTVTLHVDSKIVQAVTQHAIVDPKAKR